MSVDIIRGATRKPGSSRMLADAIAGQRNLSGQLFTRLLHKLLCIGARNAPV